MTARLVITDGTKTISLLGSDGYILASWRPSISGYKGGGVFQSSSLSDGRRLVQKVFDNTVERFDLKARGIDQDTLIRTTQELRRLLEKAAQYWTTNWQDEPVWIEAKATGETNTRYAIIHTGMIPEDENPFSQPFLQNCSAVMDNLTLMVERGHWLDGEPGTGTCVEVSGLQESWGAVATATLAPTANTDDAYINSVGGIVSASAILVLGKAATITYDTGIRFRNVTIPAGATIMSAFVRLTSTNNASGSTVKLNLYGENNGTPAAFSTYINFVNRVRTDAKTQWNDLSSWVTGTAYDSPDITDIVQEIIDRGDWASGNDLAIFLQDPGNLLADGSDPHAIRYPASFDNVTHTAPQLIIDYVADPIDFGRVATCLDEVYISNKKNLAQLTNVYHYDANTDTWSGNLIGAALPFAFLPAVPADTPDDAVYFGINTTITDSGPFNSLVFDIGDAQADISSIVWEYWNGAAWVAIVTIQDNTDDTGDMTTAAFNTQGVNSVHWVPVSSWAPVSLVTAVAAGSPAITGYWVRARVDAAGVGATPPTQQSRDIYTITWPYIEIGADEVTGDIVSLAKVVLRNTADTDGPGGSATNFYDSRVLCGLRSLSRGEDFSAYLNCSDAWAAGVGGQNPTGITVVAADGFNTNEGAATGRRAQYNYGGAGVDAFADRCVFTLDETIARQYYGTFHAYVYAGPTAVAGDISVRLRILSSIGGQAFTLPAESAQSTVAEVFDCGVVRVPSDDISFSEPIDQLEIAIQISHVSTISETVYIYWLVLMPVDEWAIDAIDNANTSDSTVERGRRLEIDSVSRPNKQYMSLVRQHSDNSLVAVWRPITNGPAILQTSVAQRLWFLSLRTSGAGETFWISSTTTAHSVRVESITRYLSMRGDR